MAWSLTEETLLIRIRVAAILFHMAFIPAPFAVVVLALWHNHDLDLRTGVLTGRGGMKGCVAPFAPQGLELWWRDLPGSSHDISARTSGARLFLWTIRRPMIFATAEVALPVPIVAIVLGALLLIIALILLTFWIAETVHFFVAFLLAVVTSRIFRGHCIFDVTNGQQMNTLLLWLYMVMEAQDLDSYVAH